MTLNGVMTVILHYFTEFASFQGALCKSSRSLSYLLMSSCKNYEAEPTLSLIRWMALLFIRHMVPWQLLAQMDVLVSGTRMHVPNWRRQNSLTSQSPAAASMLMAISLHMHRVMIGPRQVLLHCIFLSLIYCSLVCYVITSTESFCIKYKMYTVCVQCSDTVCWLGGRKGIRPVKNGGMVEVATR